MAVSQSYREFVLEQLGRVTPVTGKSMFGGDTMIDVLVREIPNAQKGFRLLFSETPFPGYQVKLEWAREEYGGNWYFSPEFKMEGWLCPALFKYFEKAPKQIYVKAEPSAQQADAS